MTVSCKSTSQATGQSTRGPRPLPKGAVEWLKDGPWGQTALGSSRCSAASWQCDLKKFFHLPELQLPSLQNGGDNTCLVGFLGGLNETPDGDNRQWRQWHTAHAQTAGCGRSQPDRRHLPLPS